MNTSIKVLITIPFTPELIEQIEAVSQRLVVTTSEAKKLEEIPEEIWGDIDILFTHKIVPTPDLAPNLKWIQFYRAGNELFMDAPILAKSDLIASSLSGASAPQVAEYVIEMILALGHHLPDIIEHQKRAEWPAERAEIFSPVELNQSIVGIIGYGSIGREVARLLNAFGATVLATKFDAKQPADPGYRIEGSGDPIGDYVHRLYPAQALSSMMKECDFVVVCVPFTRDTQDLIGDKQLASMKPTAFLIDVSRGGIIDHGALIAALEGDQIAGAALDVYPEEPLPKEEPLWKFPNVILTPHIAGISNYYDQRAVSLFVENLNLYLDGKDPLNLIDLQRGY
jgi:phosphoglycerate dehydrogenase-like enzyme